MNVRTVVGQAGIIGDIFMELFGLDLKKDLELVLYLDQISLAQVKALINLQECPLEQWKLANPIHRM